MAKLRIHELAKELGLENKALLDLCIEIGLEGKSSHSNTLSDDEAEKLRRAVLRRAVTGRAPSAKEVSREGETFTEKRVAGNVIRRRKKIEAEEAQTPEEEAQTIEITAPPSAPFREETPNLAAEAAAKEEAIRRADALFKEEIKVEEQVEEKVEEPTEQDKAEEAEIQKMAEEVAAIEAIAAAAPEGETTAAKVAEEQRKAYEARLEAVRQRHDIRAPKILGKIELPVAAPEREKTERKTAEDKETAKKTKGKKEVVRGKKGRVAEEEDELPKHKRKRRVILEKEDILNFEEEHDGWRTHKQKKKKKEKEEGVEAGKVVESAEAKLTKKVIKMGDEILVGELAKQMGVKAGEVIMKLMSLGMMVSINQLIDFDTATIIASEFGHETLKTGTEEEDTIAALKVADEAKDLILRSPVVTVMGHVDHGKTSLLDAIRNTAVTEQEAGGITQHIGAYRVTTPSGGTVAFIDTPGHAAFTEMRSRGAKVTDIVVLVVAADDGIMPQTIEAINHAKAANVPILVAVNKIDKPGANLDRVKQQLSEHDLIPEEWGGQTILCPVSAKTKQGIDNLLENLALQAEVLELKANPTRSAIGAIIESRIDRGRGPVMTVLVQNGTLHKGDVFVAGTVCGKVRAMTSYDGKPIEEAGPSVPVEVLGADGAPLAGEELLVFPSENEARQIAAQRQQRARLKDLASRGGLAGAPLTLDTFAEMASSADKKDLNLIVKADVQGSVEAVAAALSQLSNEEVNVKVIHKAVGAVNENDVQLALASRAVLIAFNIRADARATEMAEHEGVEIRYTRIIYEIVESIEKAIKGMKEPVFKEKTLAHAEVRETFRVPKLGTIAGSYVLDGTVPRNAQVRLLRDSRVVFEGKLASLRRFKDDVKEVHAGYECGIGIDGYADLKQGDIIEVFTMEQIAVQ
uniref:Translation initiation factor IF-2 n=1 Tax=wastewater metagenome TaxID=527639 RepID=A0A0A8KWY3_9ZZZZ